MRHLLPWMFALLALVGCNETPGAARDASLDGAFDAAGDAPWAGYDLSWRPVDECILARPADSFDASAPCVPGRSEPCACDDSARGARQCRADGTWAWCRCEASDAGRPDVSDAAAPLLEHARLIAPQSGARTTTQRPTFRWVAPPAVARTRVQVCDDRPCTRVIAAQETTATAWRPTTPLRPGPTFWRVQALDDAGGVRWTSATWVFGSPRRDAAVDTSYGVLRDANGDGYDDLVVLVRGGGDLVTTLTPDTIQVYFGGADGLSPSRVQVLRPLATGGELGGYEAIVATGDVNGDGLMDIAVPEARPLPGTEGFLARVYIYLGTRSTTGCGFTRHWASYPIEYFWIPEGGLASIGGFDSRAVSIGDYDGDGFGDLLISSPRDSMQLHRGSPSGPLQIPSHLSLRYGDFAGFVGDVNGDGYADLVAKSVAADRDGEDPIYALYGNARARLDGFVQPLANPCLISCGFGYVERGADLDEDGYSDAIITGTGSAWVYPGSRNGLLPPRELDRPPMGTGSGTTPRSTFGGDLSTPGDLDGDGHLEFAIGASEAPFIREGLQNRVGPGQVFFFRGAREGVRNAPWTVISAERGVWYAGRVSSLGDYNGDGYDDFAIAASVNPELAPGVGPNREMIRVYLGGREFRGEVSGPPIDVLGDPAFANRLE